MNFPARFLRALLGAVLFLMIGVLMVLLLVSGLSAVFVSDDAAWITVGWFTLVATAGGIVALFFVSRWLREKGWGRLAAGYAVVAPVLWYAMKDEAEFKRPLTMAELSPAPARAEESWLVTLWYSPRVDRPAERTMPEHGYIAGPAGDPEKSAAYLEKNRDQVQQTWEKIAREREWFAAMNAFPAIGDLTPARFEAPIIQFKPFRTVVQLSGARAGLRALDGRGDEAIDGLLPVLEVSRKIESSARTLVRFMVARGALGTTMDAAHFVLARTKVSPEKRAALAAALEGGSGGTAGARRLLWLEYALHYEAFFAGDGLEGYMPVDGVANRVLLWLARPLFLRRATANAYADCIEDLARLAEQRQLDQLDARQRAFAGAQGRGRFKNILGGLLLKTTMVRYDKVVDNYWKKEDQRLALLAELRRPP